MSASASVSMSSTDVATFKQSFMHQVEFAIQPVNFDLRDPWPNTQDGYITRNVLHKGKFGSIKHAITSLNDLMNTDGNETRSCIIKSVSLEKLFDRVIQEINTSKKPSLLEINTPEVRFQRLVRRIVMDLFVTTRCRHENILHLHSVWTDVEGLHISMPRFHVLKDLIEAYREAHNSEAISMEIIAPIVRQLCKGLDYLHSIGIVHRDIQPEHVLLTRNATVKLCHFGQSKALVSEKTKAECRTPLGKEEFMSSEKLFNLRKARSLAECRSYGFDADVWSVGVLILSMISYFPNEKFQKLRKDFALVLDQEQMPFMWLTSDMVQLRARLLKSGGNDLKAFLNDHLFTLDPTKRLTARGVLESERFLRWCSPSIGEDKKFVKKKFIGEIDFANRQKLAIEGSNFDALESKNIPAEFYWDDSWKIIEETKFAVKIMSSDGTEKHAEKFFQFSEPEPLFQLIYSQIECNHVGLADLIPLHSEIHEMAFDLVRGMGLQKKRGHSESKTSEVVSRVYQPCEDFALNSSKQPTRIETTLYKPKRGRLASGSMDLSDSFNSSY